MNAAHTPTPRTDAAERTGKACNQSDPDQSWPWDAIKRGYDFARQLESELAEATKQRDGLADALRDIASGLYDGKKCIDLIAPKALATLEGRGK
jgi:hypothetical protein